MDENQVNEMPSEGEGEGEEAQTLINAKVLSEETAVVGDSGSSLQMGEEPAEPAAPVALIEPPEPPIPFAKVKPAPAPKEDRLAKWLQFPRRLIFLVISGGIAAGGLIALQRWSDYRLTRPELDRNMEMLWETLPNTILLLFCTLLAALLLGSIAAAIGVLVHSLGVRAGLPASVFKGLGRLLVFSISGLPTLSMGFLLLLIFFVQLDILPGSGLLNAVNDRNLGDLLPHLILPVSALAFFPAMLAAQAATREITLSRGTTSPRAMLAGMFKGLAVLLHQTGGLLSAILVAEAIFSLPGLGSRMYRAVLSAEPDFLFRAMFTLAAITLLGRMLAELFGWVGRLVNVPAQVPQPTPGRSQKTARLIWVIFCLLLLVIPGVIAIRAGGIPEHIATDVSAADHSQLPSDLHPWGTDALGRDGLARAWIGTRETLWLAVIAAGVVLLPALIGGALYAFLHSLKRFWSESLADFLFIPVDILLLLPALPFYLVLSLLVRVKNVEYSWELITVIVGALILPRAMRVFQALWAPVNRFRPAFLCILPAVGSMIFSLIYSGFVLLLTMDALGIGLQPPTPTIGSLFQNDFVGAMLRGNLTLPLGCMLLVFACLFPLFLSADALAGYFTSKEGMAHLNE